MKNIIAAGLAAIAAMYAINAVAQETDEVADDTTQGSDMYLEEIRVTCEAEAAGLPDAQAYIEECINNMKQSFTGAQE